MATKMEILQDPPTPLIVKSPPLPPFNDVMGIETQGFNSLPFVKTNMGNDSKI